MRLSVREKDAILVSVRRFDEAAQVFLFGSRAEDSKKGGDIDLLIVSERISRTDRSRIRNAICDAIGEQKIDLLVTHDASGSFVKKALSTGIALQ
jgi:predicted nucleotidyltransferase